MEELLVETIVKILIILAALIVIPLYADRTRSKYKKWIVTFIPKEEGEPIKGIAYSWFDSATVFITPLAEGRYKICPPSGFKVVGSENIYITEQSIKPQERTIIHLTNGKRNLYIRVA